MFDKLFGFNTMDWAAGGAGRHRTADRLTAVLAFQIIVGMHRRTGVDAFSGCLPKLKWL